MKLHLALLWALAAQAAVYDIGAPRMRDLWVDPVRGDDRNSGETRAQALRTFDAAWRHIPSIQQPDAGHRIRLLPGKYPPGSVPRSLESRWGTFESPVMVDAPEGGVVLPAIRIDASRYLYLIGLTFESLRCEECDHLLARGVTIHEGLRVVRSRDVFVESSRIGGPFEFVDVRRGHIYSSRIDRAPGVCLTVEDRSDEIRIEGSEIDHCEGAGFHIEGSARVRFVNNIVHDTIGPAVRVADGHSILVAHNTIHRTGPIGGADFIGRDVVIANNLIVNAAGYNIDEPGSNVKIQGNWIWSSPSAVRSPAGNSINTHPIELRADWRPSAILTPPAGNIPEVDTDRAGVPRILRTAGAYERTTTPNPLLSITPSNLRFVYPTGGASPVNVPISVSAPSPTSFTTTAGAAWLTIAPGTGITDATIQAAANPAGLAAGTYASYVDFAASGVTQRVPATLAVFAPGTTSQIFGDVPATHPWIDYIFLLNRFAITIGCRENPLAYCPADTVTQAQMAAFIIRSLFGEDFAYPAAPYFTDMPASNSLFKYVQKMRELNIHSGCNATQYCPNATVTRGDMAAFIARALFGETFQFPAAQRFSDIPPSNSLFKYVQKIWDLGVTQGCSVASYCATDPVTREQMAAFLSRSFLNYARLAPTAAPAGPVVAGCPIFPADNVWNRPVDTLPLHSSSATWVNTIGAARPVHPDFGSGLFDGGPVGIPFVVVPNGQARVPITFEYAEDSDPGPYPIPPNAPIEGGPNSTGDRHILVLEQGACRLWEVFDAYPRAGNAWTAGSGAIFDLNVNGPLRPAGWTSADAAGLPILPGLVRYEEVAAGEINHAIRFTVPQTRREYIWPARHFASSLTGAQYPPMGARFRLKPTVNLANFHPQVQVILRAMQKYGIILADNGSAWFISGVPDERWNNDVLRQIRQLTGSDFEAVDTSSMRIDVNSGQSR